MKKDLLNFSTDLRRISYWAYEGKDDLVKETLQRARRIYKLPKKIGPFQNIWEEIKKIEKQEDGQYVTADRAGTVSSILLLESSGI